MEASLSNGRPRGGEPHPHLRPAPEPSDGTRAKGPEPQNPRMLVQPFLLLALEQWQSHGYELVRRLSAFGFEALDRGSVYRILRQLERDLPALPPPDTNGWAVVAENDHRAFRGIDTPTEVLALTPKPEYVMYE